MSIERTLNWLNGMAGLLVSAGVFYEFSLGWAFIVAGIYLAYNVITTIRILNVRTPPDDTEESEEL